MLWGVGLFVWGGFFCVFLGGGGGVVVVGVLCGGLGFFCCFFVFFVLFWFFFGVVFFGVGGVGVCLSVVAGVCCVVFCFGFGCFHIPEQRQFVLTLGGI